MGIHSFREFGGEKKKFSVYGASMEFQIWDMEEVLS